MNDQSRSITLLEVLTNVYHTYSNIKNFIDKSFTDVYSRENLPLDHVFFVLVLCFEIVVV